MNVGTKYKVKKYVGNIQNNIDKEKCCLIKNVKTALVLPPQNKDLGPVI
jgi:hypothetical protein